ncbi:hypothetical protein VP1G_10785 [Cytospora mali]|uniref:Uncharacterized protein n=1 Tax=Cytospora mali TaxID=578113 RepID=A0A194UW86_CYTMA|nr:hypothetical protein VP1G_10785 [Valsa mali var. pyri (nom. inval.)]
MEDENTQRARSGIKLRVTCLQLQLDLQRLTPSLRKQISHAIEVHSEALQQPDFAADQDLVSNLDNLHDRIEEHWNRVYKSYLDHSFLLGDIGQYQRFLTAILLAEYTGAPYTCYDSANWVHHRAGIVEQHRAGMVDNNVESTYRDGIVSAADHEQQQPPGGCIQHCIGQCDWQKLAQTLLNDRELALDLFEFQSLIPGCFDENVRARVLQNMKSIEHKYFTDLANSAGFAISKHAMSLSARRASGSPNHKSSLELEPEEFSTIVSRKSHAKSIFNTIADGIKSL